MKKIFPLLASALLGALTLFGIQCAIPDRNYDFLPDGTKVVKRYPYAFDARRIGDDGNVVVTRYYRSFQPSSQKLISPNGQLIAETLFGEEIPYRTEFYKRGVSSDSGSPLYDYEESGLTPLFRVHYGDAHEYDPYELNTKRQRIESTLNSGDRTTTTITHTYDFENEKWIFDSKVVSHWESLDWNPIYELKAEY